MRFDSNRIELGPGNLTDKNYLLKEKDHLLREYDSIKALKSDVEREGFEHLEKIYQRRMGAIEVRLNNFLKLSHDELVATLAERCEVIDLLSLKKFVQDKESALSERLIKIENQIANTLGKK